MPTQDPTSVTLGNTQGTGVPKQPIVLQTQQAPGLYVWAAASGAHAQVRFENVNQTQTGVSA